MIIAIITKLSEQLHNGSVIMSLNLPGGSTMQCGIRLDLLCLAALITTLHYSTCISYALDTNIAPRHSRSVSGSLMNEVSATASSDILNCRSSLSRKSVCAATITNNNQDTQYI